MVNIGCRSSFGCDLGWFGGRAFLEATYCCFYKFQVATSFNLSAGQLAAEMIPSCSLEEALVLLHIWKPLQMICKHSLLVDWIELTRLSILVCVLSYLDTEVS